MSIIKNKEDLIANASSPKDQEARRIALDAVEKALKAVNPKEIVHSKVKLKGEILKVEDTFFNLSQYRRIFILGGGKASGTMAEALEEILEDRIEEGIIVVPKGTAAKHKLKHIRLHESSHPIPDKSSMMGAKKILELAEKAGEKDLVICLISGGGSSLMALPRGNISLLDKQKVTDMLLKCGATINEINAVRKHISSFKGGHLAKAIYPAHLLGLLLSDVLGDPLDVIASGPTVPDSSTFNDAVSVLKRHGLWDKTPKSVRQVLSEGLKGRISETPKENDPAFKKVKNIIIGNNRLACSAALEEIKRNGLNALFLTSFMEGEARHIGTFFGALAKELMKTDKPKPIFPPAGVIAGGETTVTVIGNGIGGRNQELALSAALKIAGADGIAIVSASTDGIDGPTDAAGAIVDGKTLLRSSKLGLNPEDFLRNNDSYSFFSRLNDLVMTGPTGTNVNDITVLVKIYRSQDSCCSRSRVNSSSASSSSSLSLGQLTVYPPRYAPITFPKKGSIIISK